MMIHISFSLVVENCAIHNDRLYVVTYINTEEQKKSFFPKTTEDWNMLETEVVHAYVVGRFKAMVVKTSN